jgi:hypothetical protein
MPKEPSDDHRAHLVISSTRLKPAPGTRIARPELKVMFQNEYLRYPQTKKQMASPLRQATTFSSNARKREHHSPPNEQHRQARGQKRKLRE